MVAFMKFRILLLLFVCCFVLPLQAQFFFERAIGVPYQIKQFDTPNDVAVDAQGNIYVSDESNQIKKFDANGNPILQWGAGGSGNGQFNMPARIAIAANGDVYVADYFNSNIQKFTSSGGSPQKIATYGSGEGQVNWPGGLDISPDGSIYIADTYNHRIQKFNSSGQYVTQWGSQGSGNGQFLYPSCVAVDLNGDVYVGEGNNRIQKFSSSGGYKSQFGSTGGGDGQFNFPDGIAVDASGNVFVADRYNNRIQKFNILGSFITKWGSSGSADGQFNQPRGIDIDANGFVYATDMFNKRIQKFTSSGGFVWKLEGTISDGQLNDPDDLALDANGNVFVADMRNHRIQKFKSDGTFLSKIGTGTYGWADGQLDRPTGVAVDAAGNIYVVDGNPAPIHKFSSSGVFQNTWGTFGTADGQFISPHSIAIDASGNIYITETGNHRVQKFSSSGVFITKWGALGFGNGDFNSPFGIAVDALGYVYVADTYNDRIQKFTSNGDFVTKWNFSAANDGQLPTAITVSANGFVYVVGGNNHLQKFTSSGDLKSSYGVYGWDNGTLRAPQGITVDASGNVYISDSNNRVQKFSVLDILSLSTNNGAPSSSITITGSGFSNVPSENIVKFNGVAATVTSTSPNSLTVTVPSGATTGLVSITRQGFTVASANEFLILPLAISSFTPSVGVAGSSITISGSGFSSIPSNNIVKFNGIAATVTTSTSTTITATLPAGNTVGKITVSVNGVAASSTNNFEGILSINSFTPVNGLTGSTITITGTGFSSTPNNQAVKFNGIDATVTASTSTSLTVSVPTGATTGKISVLRDGVTVQSASEFLVLPLAITFFSPAVAVVGSTITLNGTGFSSVAANNMVTFNGISTTVINSTSTSLTTTVPPGATTGKIMITVSGVSTASGTDFIVTKLAVTLSSFPEYFGVENESATATLQVNDVREIQSLKINSYGISEDIVKLKVNPISFTSDGNSVQVIVPASYFTDPLGLHYWFSAVDKAGNEIQSDKGYTYLKYPATSSKQVIPELKNGKSAAAYQLISVPLVLSKNTIKEVFKNLGEYDNKSWRLFFLTGNQTIQESPSDIKPGTGYWFIMRDQIEINPGEGVVVKATPDTPYKMSLKQGWNLIGNPYNFTISWNDVITRNGLGEEKIKFRQFINGGFANEPLLKPYRGGFVNSDVAREIEIPVINKSTTGGRISSKQFHAIDQRQWEVSLTLQEGDFTNSLFGFGMNPNASLEEDLWDETALPMLDGLSSFELSFNHNLIKEVVPYKENYSWTGNLSNEQGVMMKWDNSYFGINDKQLILEISDRVELIDMRVATQVTLPAGKHTLKFHYGAEEYVNEQVIEKNVRIGTVYPNPFDRKESVMSIPISLPEGENEIELAIQNMMGGKIELSAVGKYNGGRQLLQWNADFNQLSAGLFVLRVKSYNPSIGVNTYFSKLILK